MQSDFIKQGVERAPNRSLLYALGLTKEEISRPIIGVVSSYNEIVPGHMNIDKIADAVKAGVRAAGGTPIEFPAIVGGNCYIRTAPNTYGKILGVAHRGDTLPYGGQVSDGGWLLVQYKGQNAWVSGKYGRIG